MNDKSPILSPQSIQEQAQSRLLLVDGSSYLYRAYHAMPDLRADPRDPDSQATGAVRGVHSMLLALQKETPAQYLACVFDAPGPTFRDALYPEYKVQRSPMPDDLRSQIALIHGMVQDMGWPVLSITGVEADDVIGTLARLGALAGMDVLISSGDKDLAQLVTEKITIVDTMGGKRRDCAGVLAEFGVTPAQMLDFQTLMGDAVDNVPGVAKVGPKTAAKWLQKYGSLEGVIDNAASIAGVVGENLRQALNWLPQARALLQIKTDCEDLPAVQEVLPHLPSLIDLQRKPENETALMDFYARMGFKSLLQKAHTQETKTTVGTGLFPDMEPAQESLNVVGTGTGTGTGTGIASGIGSSVVAAAQPSPTASSVQKAAVAMQFETILSWPSFERWLSKIKQAKLTALDTETTSLDAMTAQLVGMSFSVQTGEAAYLPLAHTETDAIEQLPIAEVLQKLKPWLEDSKHRKLGQNIKYDSHILANVGISVQGYEHDTMLESYVLESHRRHSLESLAQRHLGRSGLAFEDLCGKGASQISFAQVLVANASVYACEDAEQTLAVHQVLWPQIEADAKLAWVYALEMQGSQVLFAMERQGVLIDAMQLKQESHALGKRLLELENTAHSLAQQPFNLGSPKQIGEIFFQKMGFPVIKKTPKGEPSTNEEVLERLAQDYPLAACILEHRSLAKLKNTYTDKLAALALKQTGRVHTNYAQAVAVTGRLASNDPNLQNIPIRTVEGRRVRKAFVAAPDHLIVSADYSQIELRIMAHLSHDEALLKAFRQGDDVHRATASEVFGIAQETVSSEQRRYAKTINFGLIYGMSAFGLAKSLGIENKAAQHYIERYFERYPGVRRYMEETKGLAKEQGFVETVFGRRLYLPEINSPNGPRRAAAERAAINAPMQGTAADLIKLSMVAVHAALQARAKGSVIIMQVHDELVLEVPEADLSWVREKVPQIMADVAQLQVPLETDVGVGHNWDEAH